MASDLHPDSASAVRRQKIQLWLQAIIAIVLVGWALRAAAIVLVPFVFAIFVALVVAPVDHWVQHRVPGWLRWLGHAAAVVLMLAVLALFFGSIWFAAQRIVSEFPAVSQQVEQAIPGLDQEGTSSGQGASGTSADQGGGQQTGATGGQDTAGGATPSAAPGIIGSIGGATGQLGQSIADYASRFASTILASAGTVLSAIVLILFFALLMLIEAPAWKEKSARVLSPGAQHDTHAAVAVMASRFRWYLLVRTLLGIATGVLYALWLWIFGVDLLIVWGLLAFVLNFIPTLGSLIAGILPVLYAATQKDVGTALAVGAGILVIEQIMGNYVDPRVQGKQLSLSPLVVLLSLALWYWIWGVPGALLAVPVMIAVVIVCAHFPRLQPVALFLSDERTIRDLEETTTKGR